MKLNYRPEIDGLRAIAVCAVIFYHTQVTIFNIEPFKGGFIGVDIFFVISGYLITSIILKELLITGTFSFRYFYERRVRRILPALLAVMIVSLPFAWMYLLPSNFLDFSKSILYSLGFGSNYYFYSSGQEYGAVSGLLKPFLHTWSLSVEEQFYILFPLVLLIFFKFLKRYLIFILILVFLLSLGLSDWYSKNFPSISFYFIHTRVWELLAGSILAYFEIKRGYRSNHRILNLTLPTVGLLLIIITIFFFKLYFPHPALHTVPAILGVCLIIWFSNSNENEFVTRLLSTRLFVGIGLISYSLYLWHYPIFAFDRITGFSQGYFLKKLLIGISVLIFSFISYYYIEKPFRNKNNKFRVILILIIFSILSLVILNSNIISNKGYENRVPKLLRNIIKEPPVLKNFENESCINKVGGCKFNTSSNKKVYIIGDSHIVTLMYDLKDKIIKKGYQFITHEIDNCFFYPGFDQIHILTKKTYDCTDEYFQKLKEKIMNDGNSIVIFGGRIPLSLTNIYFDNQEGGIEGKDFWFKYISLGKYSSLQESFKNEVSQLSNKNEIILIYPIPEVGWDVPNKIWISRKNKLFAKSNLTTVTTSYKVYKERNKSSFEMLDSVTGKNIYRVYPHELFCDTIVKNRCVTHDEKSVFYSDTNHPSPKSAQMINDLIIKKINQIESKL